MIANLNANVHATGKHKDVPVFQRLKPLLADYPPPCLSLYQQLFRAFPDSQQNPVHFRNLLKELTTALERNRRGVASEKLLEPFERLLDDAELGASAGRPGSVRRGRLFPRRENSVAGARAGRR